MADTKHKLLKALQAVEQVGNDIADMANDFIITRDKKSLQNYGANIASIARFAIERDELERFAENMRLKAEKAEKAELLDHLKLAEKYLAKIVAEGLFESCALHPRTALERVSAAIAKAEPVEGKAEGLLKPYENIASKGITWKDADKGKVRP